MLIMGLIPRATHDIDVLRCTAYELVSLMPKYDMNMNVTAHIGCFADDYSSRELRDFYNDYKEEFKK